MSWEEAVERFDIRKLHRNADLNNIKYLPEKLIEFGKKWINSDWLNRPSLFLTGSVGSGKTYFMVAILKGLYEKKCEMEKKIGHPIPFWPIYKRSSDLFDALYERLLEYKSNQSMLEMYMKADILFLDDVGIENMTDRVKKEYFSIIDYRIHEQLPFVFTSNFTKEEFGNLLGDRVKSRMQMCIEIEFPDRDLRKELNFYSI